jgi:hypothetical protein
MSKLTHSNPGINLKVPERNRYFYGKLMDTYHFELEQEYFNAKRRLLNRLVTGFGVVCGLDVETVCRDGQWWIIVKPGVAIDRCGREIIVPEEANSILRPPIPAYDRSKIRNASWKRGEAGRHAYCEDEYVHVVLCYHECESNPVPALASDCLSPILCAPGSIHEKYKIEIRENFAPERKNSCLDLIKDGRIDHDALAEYVTKDCRSMPRDCCIPLANILLVDDDGKWRPEPDITVRSIAYTNRLLFALIDELALSLRHEEEHE